MSQDVSNADISGIARKNHSIALQRLASVGLGPVAKALGVSESTVSRHKDQHLEELTAMLAVLGLKVVPVELRLYRSEDIEPLIALARQRMESLRSADQLAFDEGYLHE